MRGRNKKICTIQEQFFERVQTCHNRQIPHMVLENLIITHLCRDQFLTDTNHPSIITYAHIFSAAINSDRPKTNSPAWANSFME